MGWTRSSEMPQIQKMRISYSIKPLSITSLGSAVHMHAVSGRVEMVYCLLGSFVRHHRANFVDLPGVWAPPFGLRLHVG